MISTCRLECCVLHTITTIRFFSFPAFFKVDLKCVTSANGPYYYRDCLAKAGANRLQVGDRVSVCLDVEVLDAIGYGTWIDDMAVVRELYVPSSHTHVLFSNVFFFFISIFFGVCCGFCRTSCLLG